MHRIYITFLAYLFIILIFTFPETVTGIEGKYEGDNPSTVTSPPIILQKDLIEFFTTRSSRILSIDGDIIKIDKGFKDGIKRFMRFEVITPKTIRHPVTQEDIGIADIKIGVIEITEVYEDYSVARLIKGEALKDAKVTIPSVLWKIFLQEERDVDYFIADEYYRALKSSKRFDFVYEASLSDITIILSLKTDTTGSQKLKQVAVWTDSGNAFLETEADVTAEYLGRIKKEKALYEQELKGADLLLSFRLPGSGRFINVADIDGDGSPELAVATDSSIEFYRIGISLKGLYEIKLRGEPIGLFSADINRDTRAEIIVPLLSDNRVYSEIYELKDGEFKSIYKADGFLRPACYSVTTFYTNKESSCCGCDRLLVQGFDSEDGIAGEIKIIVGGEVMVETIPIARADISGLATMCKKEGPSQKNCMNLAYDEDGYLNLFDTDGTLLWRSKEDTGGFFFTFEKTRRSPILEPGKWSVKDRLVVEDDNFYIIKRRPVSGIARGIGWTSSEIVSLRWNGIEMESQVIKEVGGTILDFSLTRDRLYILQKPFMGISIGSLLKGENPKSTRLYIFKRP